MKKAILITVRTGSTRLPQKALLDIEGQTTIAHLIEGVKLSRKADEIILCTTKLEEDDVLCKIAEKRDIKYFRGSTSDKLERWRGACEKFGIDFFVTADGDDIFCEAELIDLAFEQSERTNVDFIQSKDVICGSFTYGIKTEALNKVCDIKDTNDTEMMWVYFTDTGLFNVQELENVPEVYKRDDIRMTLDYDDDFIFFRDVIKELGEKGYYESGYGLLRNIVNLIDRKPEMAKINYHLQEVWSKNQKQKTKLVIKNEKHK